MLWFLMRLLAALFGLLLMGCTVHATWDVAVEARGTLDVSIEVPLEVE